MSASSELRRREILKQIHQHGKVSVVALSEAFQVCSETVRGDLKKLEQDKSLIRTHGGAVAKPLETISFFSRIQNNVQEKQIIARRAVSLVKPKDRLFIDASSTSFFLARELVGLDNLTIITDSVRIVLELASSPGLRLICVGGSLRSSSFSLVGPLAVECVEKYHANIFFCSCTGLTRSDGATESDEFEIEVKQAMANRAERIALLIDHTKFGQVGLSKFLGLERIDDIISDEWTEELLQEYPAILTEPPPA
ncbi:MAG: DeoR/GlpR family DNA-binding transcription regulator [Deltaproteobacteria bacterium]|jgi:DeoR/GlpR family transcriptional regulator of sugar metabolism|nr:DeoR/GlpR family DNA-binding transcription regulator [Deltaproteobacteria bacterium]